MSDWYAPYISALFVVDSNVRVPIFVGLKNVNL